MLAKLAEIRGWGLDKAEARTEAAFFALFDRIPRPPMSGVLDFTILGCGFSGGVPRADGEWGRLRSRKSQRTAASRYARPPWSAGGRTEEGVSPTTVIVDTSPDLRLQAVAAGVKRVDAAPDHPRPRRPDPRHRRPARLLPAPLAGGFPTIWTPRPHIR